MYTLIIHNSRPVVTLGTMGTQEPSVLDALTLAKRRSRLVLRFTGTAVLGTVAGG
jgi:uncharacterized protein involved in exopolysaccharide biosynthesis